MVLSAMYKVKTNIHVMSTAAAIICLLDRSMMKAAESKHLMADLLDGFGT